MVVEAAPADSAGRLFPAEGKAQREGSPSHVWKAAEHGGGEAAEKPGSLHMGAELERVRETLTLYSVYAWNCPTLRWGMSMSRGVRAQF